MDRIAVILYHIDVAKIHSEESGGGHRWRNVAPDPLFSGVSFHVLCAYRMELGTEWVRGFHRTHYDRLYFVEDGAALLEFDGGVVDLMPGCLYLVPAHTRHRHACDDRIVMSWCHFQAEAEAGIDLLELLRVPPELAVVDAAAVASDFGELVDAMCIEAGWGMLSRANLLLRLLMPFLQAADDSDLREARTRYLPVLRFIDGDPGRPVTLDQLAALMNLSTEHFCRSFSRDLHLSPMRYVMRKRIQRAQHLLCQTDLKQHRIGEQCGFGDPYHFSKSFKRISGMTPSEYRRHYRQGAGDAG